MTCDVSIIVPTLNRADSLINALASFTRQPVARTAYEVLVVDNGSTDDTKTRVLEFIDQHEHQRIRYIHEPIPGLLSGRHRGAKEAAGNILAFVDDDIEAGENWLPSIVEAFKDKNTHLVGGPSVPKFQSPPPDWMTQYFQVDENGLTCGHLSLLHKGSEKIEIDPHYVWGLNYSIRKETLYELGGFHPDCIPKHLQHFQGDGETGLSAKLAQKRYKAYYIPEAKVTHHIPPGRLTIEYFESRLYYQGVCDSFSAIRRNRGPSGISIPAYPRVIPSTTESPHTSDHVIRARIQKAYVDGFLFHHTAVARNNALLAWVLKEDYFDYALPDVIL